MNARVQPPIENKTWRVNAQLIANGGVANNCELYVTFADTGMKWEGLILSLSDETSLQGLSGEILLPPAELIKHNILRLVCSNARSGISRIEFWRYDGDATFAGALSVPANHLTCSHPVARGQWGYE